MPALATLTLVWLGARQPDPAGSATLAAWAEANAVRLEAPRHEVPADTAREASIAGRCETLLDQARDQLQAGDEASAGALLAEVDETLRAHPELLQAGWLMAERHRAEARLLRSTSPDRAMDWARRADIIEGTRAAAFGETATPSASAAKIRVEIVVHGARRHEIAWDGVLSSDEISTLPGEHHLLVLRGARVAWAGWVSALAPGKIDVWVPDSPACSVEDFERVAVDAGMKVSVPAGVRCGSWLAVSPGPRPGTLALARCQADRCEPSNLLSGALAQAAAPGEPADKKGSFPAWAAWTLAGAGVVAATSIILWRTGAFDTAKEAKVFYDGTNL
jgi:hypothetical protein